jgi:hypothetical protein
MKGLWRKTAKLFLSYPVLWLPYVCAQLLNDSLYLLQSAADMRVIQTHFATAPAMIAWLPAMDWGLRYLTLCIDTVALVVTAMLVTMIVRGKQPRLRAAFEELRSYPKRILGYSFKLYLLSVAFAIFVSRPALHLLNWVTHSTVATSWSRVANVALVQGQGLVSLVLFAWIITPITIRLMRVPGAEPPSTDEKKFGRYFVILIGSSTFVLSNVLFPILLKLAALRSFPEQVYFSLVHLVLSFPYLMGNIAVALIAISADWNPGESSTDRMRRGIVRKLMPLHFGEREEH